MVSTLTSTSFSQNFYDKDQDSYFICQCLSQALTDIYVLLQTSNYLIEQSSGTYFTPLKIVLKQQCETINQAAEYIVERIQVLGWFNRLKYQELINSVQTNQANFDSQSLYLSISAYHCTMSKNLQAIAIRSQSLGDFDTAALLDQLSVAHHSYAQQLSQILDLN